MENHTAALTDSHKVDALWERRLSGKTLKEKRCVRRNGKNCWYESHKLPSEPQLFFMGDNVNIATDAAILNHDIVSVMINNINGLQKCNIRRGVTMCSLADNPLSCTM